MTVIFTELVDTYRGELLVHCYRMLGSVQDAEDAVQETLLAAWRGLEGFEGRSSVRTWLYRIATNRCLNSLRAVSRRPAPVLPVVAPEPTRHGEPSWLQPYPDVLLEGLPDEAPGPEARYEVKESVSLAFMAAIHTLPPQQRAVLVLRDVLGLRSREVAAMLELSEDAVNGSLKRARAVLPVRSETAEAPVPHEVLSRFAEALEAGDVDRIVELLTADVWLTMPPATLEYQGHAAVAEFLRVVGFRRGNRRYRLVPCGANGQPAFGCYVSDGDETLGHAHGLLVLTFTGDRISAVTRFLDNSVLPYFGLPRSL